jgi:hypothetical protein
VTWVVSVAIVAGLSTLLFSSHGELRPMRTTSVELDEPPVAPRASASAGH